MFAIVCVVQGCRLQWSLLDILRYVVGIVQARLLVLVLLHISCTSQQCSLLSRMQTWGAKVQDGAVRFSGQAGHHELL